MSSMENSAQVRCILFDWGDTLMRSFGEFSGPMADWPRVEALPHAAEVLEVLQPIYRLAVATNADISSDADIRRALQRVGLNSYFEKIYCFRNLGVQKPQPEYFSAVLKDLRLEAGQVVMVGDHFDADVLGAVNSGLRAVWFNWRTEEDRHGPGYETMHDLRELPELLGFHQDLSAATG
jgi:putative hydrolase of the HAD superfamily